jgi:hypothetical protein
MSVYLLNYLETPKACVHLVPVTVRASCLFLQVLLETFFIQINIYEVSLFFSTHTHVGFHVKRPLLPDLNLNLKCVKNFSNNFPI